MDTKRLRRAIAWALALAWQTGIYNPADIMDLVRAAYVNGVRDEGASK